MLSDNITTTLAAFTPPPVAPAARSVHACAYRAALGKTFTFLHQFRRHFDLTVAAAHPAHAPLHCLRLAAGELGASRHRAPAILPAISQHKHAYHRLLDNTSVTFSLPPQTVTIRAVRADLLSTARRYPCHATHPLFPKHRLPTCLLLTTCIFHARATTSFKLPCFCPPRGQGLGGSHHGDRSMCLTRQHGLETSLVNILAG